MLEMKSIVVILSDLSYSKEGLVRTNISIRMLNTKNGGLSKVDVDNSYILVKCVVSWIILDHSIYVMHNFIIMYTFDRVVTISFFLMLSVG